MSAAGVFNLQTNDGKADRIILALDYLKKRLSDITCYRKAQGMKDIMPTLRDIEKTHILFTNAHFKPFVACAQEYMKVRPSSGTPSLGNTIQFQIPQFGDFFHDIVMRATLSSVNSSVQTVPTQATANNALTSSQIPGSTAAGAEGYDWDNVTSIADAGGNAAVTYSLVDAFGNAVSVTDGDNTYYYRNFVRYVEFPGERLAQEVKFDVNGNPLDSYEDSATVLLRKFKVGADKMTGYKRLVGQETELTGYSGPHRGQVHDNEVSTSAHLTQTTLISDVAGEVTKHQNNPGAAHSTTGADFMAANFPDEAWSCSTAAGAALGGVTQSATVGYQDVYRQSLRAVDGLQTPKYQQPEHDLWCKFKFWFCERVDNSIVSASIPSGQRYITVKLATQAQLVVEEPSLYIKRVIDSGVVTGSAVNKRTVEYRPFVRAGTLSTITLTQVELYINNLFVVPEVHDIYISRIGFTLIRVYRQHTVTVNTAGSDEKQLSQLKWPVEYMFVGLRPTWNISASNNTMYRDWHRMCKVVDVESQEWANQSSVADGYKANVSATSADGDVAALETTGATSHVFQGRDVVPVRYARECKTVNSLSLSAHGIKIFDEFSERFFSAYTPLAFGGPNVITPDDQGVMMFNFACYPGVYQPSGHINVSRAREFYLKWNSSYTSSTSSSDLIVLATTINFLLVAKGSCVLRFST
jgi:hypothetical protein